MFLDITYLEWLGYLSSVIVAISLTMSSIIKLRIYNLIGGTAFSIYGFLIGSMPVGFLNLFIVCINIYYLIKIYSQNEAFQLLKVNAEDSYINYFLDFNKNQIREFFPSFSTNKLNENKENNLVITLLRDSVVAGIFIGTKVNQVLNVQLDYVSAPYRDLKPGKFIYHQNKALFKDLGINKIQIITNNDQHIKYLKEMNFSTINANEFYLLID
ncbi:MAG: hypothetical protein ACOYM7_08505 [Paludibacter sp.]